MELSGEIHAPALLPLGKGNRKALNITGLDVPEKGKIPGFCRGSNPRSHSPIAKTCKIS